MPFQKGRAKTGGRKPGTKSRHVVDREQREAAARARVAKRMKAALGEDELDPAVVLGMCVRLAVEEGDRVGAIQAASALMPYRYPRLSQADVRVRTTVAALSDDELLREAKQIEERLSGRSLLIDGVALPAEAEPTEPTPMSEEAA